MKSILTIFIFCLSCLFCACAKESASIVQDMPAQRAEGIVITANEAGKSEWKLNATAANFYEDKRVFLENPILVLNRNAQETGSSIDAQEGAFSKNGVITLDGGVKVNAPKSGVKLSTKKLYYDTGSKIIWTDVPFTLVRNGVKIKGKALKADSDFSEIEIFKQVTELPKELRALNEASANFTL